MKMMGWLAGDSSTMVCRKAHDGDMRVAIEFEDHNAMLCLVVLQGGEIAITSTEIRGGGPIRELSLIGQVTELDDNTVDIDLFDSELVTRQLILQEPAIDILQVAPDTDD